MSRSSINSRAIGQNSGVWKTLDSIKTEDGHSSKKMADIAMNRNLVNESTHRKRQAKRSQFLDKVFKIVRVGEGSVRDKLRALASLQEKIEAE